MQKELIRDLKIVTVPYNGQDLLEYSNKATRLVEMFMQLHMPVTNIENGPHMAPGKFLVVEERMTTYFHLPLNCQTTCNLADYFTSEDRLKFWENTFEVNRLVLKECYNPDIIGRLALSYNVYIGESADFIIEVGWEVVSG